MHFNAKNNINYNCRNLSAILELQVKKEKLEAHVDTNDDNSIDRTR